MTATKTKTKVKKIKRYAGGYIAAKPLKKLIKARSLTRQDIANDLDVTVMDIDRWMVRDRMPKAKWKAAIKIYGAPSAVITVTKRGAGKPVAKNMVQTLVVRGKAHEIESIAQVLRLTGLEFTIAI